MRLSNSQPQDAGRLLSLFGLLSVACVSMLTFAVSGAATADSTEPEAAGLLLAALAIGFLTFLGWVGLYYRAAAKAAGRTIRHATAAAAQTTYRLDAAEAILRSEPQVLLVWEPGAPAHIVAHGAAPTAGIPWATEEITQWHAWLEPQPAQLMVFQMERLFREGHPFTMPARTTLGTEVEIEGRTAGGRAVLRIREVGALRREIGEAQERSRRQVRDIQITRGLLEGLTAPVWFRAPDGKIEWVNSAYIRAVDGLSREDVRARQLELLEAKQRKTVDAALKRGRIHREIMPLIIAGERRTFDLLAVPLEGTSAFIANDAAALETAKGELSRQMATNDRTLDRVATAVAIFGPDQSLTFCNAAYRSLWRLDQDWLATHPRDGEILDRLREQRQLPEDADYRNWKAKLLACYTGQREHEDWWHMPNGRTVHVLAEQRPGGGVTYLYDDVTERIALESRYNTLMSVQTETLDHLKEGVAVFATDGRLRLHNSAFARIWRLNPQDLSREPHIEEVVLRCRVLYDHPETWQRINGAVTGIFDQRQRIEGHMERPDDSVVAYAGLPLPDGALLLTFVDITGSARAERMLTERNEALETANRLKNQFISHVSYELRTPLTDIIGFAEMLANPRTGALNQKQLEYLGYIGASSKTLAALINDILDLATIDAGIFELKLAPVRARPVIEAVAAGLRERMTRARLSLRISVAAGVDEFLGDEHRIKQVLFNLLSNAIGFSKQGDTIGLTCGREQGMIVFTVEDHGTGIAKEVLPKVFERFESRTQGSRHRGAGLGLALAKSFVELHGGTISLESEIGRGTRVTVRFPEQQPVAGLPAAARSPATSRSGRQAA